MATFVDFEEQLVGVYDHGATYLAVMENHLESADGYLGEDWESFAWSAPLSNPDITPLKTPAVFIDTNQHREFHYRFIPIPNPLVLLSPPLNSDNPVHLAASRYVM